MTPGQHQNTKSILIILQPILQITPCQHQPHNCNQPPNDTR
jgi:hypothetical protein